MATSGTVAFQPNVEEIITEAFERCGIDTQTQTGNRAVSARRSLNLLFAEWANRGINYWAVEQQTLTLVNGTLQYTLPVGTIDIIDAVIRDSSGADTSDQIINRVSIADYNIQYGLLGNQAARRRNGVKPRCRYSIPLERVHLRWAGKQIGNEIRG